MCIKFEMWSVKVLRGAAVSLEHVILPQRKIASSVKGINFNSKHLKKGIDRRHVLFYILTARLAVVVTDSQFVTTTAN